MAEATARGLARVSLADALELTILIAQKDPRRHPRVAVRWLQRYLEEHEVTLNDAALIMAALSALVGECREEAVRVLRTAVGSF